LHLLILSRRPGEKLILETSDGPIEVVLHRIDGQQAMIGIDAPKSVTVLRDELLDKLEAG
jgi:carbon storage regulator CsrA